MDAGKLSSRIIIQAPSTDDDGYGGRVNTWINLFEVWAKIQPLKGQFLWYANQIDEKVGTRITIWYREDVKPGYRIIHGTTVYRISSVTDPTTSKEIIEINCEALLDECLQGTLTKPAIASPLSGELDFSLTGNFESSDFADADTHTATRWQITAGTDTNIKEPIVDLTSSTDLTSITMPVGKLTIDTTYLVRVRYIGKKFAMSPWSDVITFKTTDI